MRSSISVLVLKKLSTKLSTSSEVLDNGSSTWSIEALVLLNDLVTIENH